MKNKNIVILIIALIVIIIGIVWFSAGSKQSPSKVSTENRGAVVNNVVSTSTTDTTDMAIQNDFDNVTKQLDALNADSSHIDNVMPK